jgi:hypothetical protein
VKNNVFYPKYRIRGSSDVLSLSLFGSVVVAGLFIWGGTSPLSLFLLLINFLFVLSFSGQYVRRIEFTSSYFLIIRYTRLPKKVNYSDITDLGYYTVKFRSNEISFTAMDNLRELHTIFLKLVEEGKIRKTNLEHKAANEEWVNAKAFRPAIVACIVLSIPVFFFWIRYLGDLSFYLGLLGLLVMELSMCFAVIAAFQWYYKRRMK